MRTFVCGLSDADVDSDSVNKVKTQAVAVAPAATAAATAAAASIITLIYYVSHEFNVDDYIVVMTVTYHYHILMIALERMNIITSATAATTAATMIKIRTATDRQDDYDNENSAAMMWTAVRRGPTTTETIAMTARATDINVGCVRRRWRREPAGARPARPPRQLRASIIFPTNPCVCHPRGGGGSGGLGPCRRGPFSSGPRFPGALGGACERVCLLELRRHRRARRGADGLLARGRGPIYVAWAQLSHYMSVSATMRCLL